MPKKSGENTLGIIKENINEANRSKDISQTLKNAHICELAFALKDHFGDSEYIKSILSQDRLSVGECALFAVEFSKYVDKNHESLPFFSFTEVADDPMTAYFRNSLSDLAFRAFSKELTELRAVYYGSFSACAEDVSSGISDCCMLPIYDYSDGEMWSVRRLMEKHDLSIVMTLDLPTTSDESNFVRFALLSRESWSAKDADMLRVTAFFDDQTELAPFLEGCFAIGATLEGAVTVPSSFYDTQAIDIDFNVPKECFHPLGVYLSLFYPRTNIGGIYKRLETT